jgi:hypothetical protein
VSQARCGTVGMLKSYLLILAKKKVPATVNRKKGHLMNRNKSIAVTIFTILVIFGPDYIVNGQGRTRPKTRPRPPATSPAPATAAAPAKLPVIVNLKDGQSVKGHFIRADAENVQVEVQSGKLSIKMSEVFSMIFEADEETPSKSIEEVVKNLDKEPADPTLPVVRKAYTALRRLAEAGQLKVPYSQYSAQLFEAKAVVDEALGVLPDGAIKIDMTRALEVFTDAARAWGAVTRNDRIPINTEPGSTLMEKYKIKPELNAVSQADHLKLDTALKTILATAEPMLRNIAFIMDN